ncbi:MAG: CotH kinase family protein [Bacteroidia bacterium]
MQDEDGDYSDWIELHNPTASSIDLNGWYISDDATEPDKWEFPAMRLAPNAYLVIFASGKDRQGTTLHTNFKLSASGEDLLLTEPDGTTIVFSFQGQFPVQTADTSYGFWNGQWIYMDNPTPGFPNVFGTVLSPPDFSVQRGFFDQGFSLSLSTAIDSGQIVYTLDGSLPTANNGMPYQAPISINNTSLLRAVVLKNGQTSRAETHTYLFLDSVIHQSNNPPGYPNNWGSFSTISGTAPADYEMDPEITQSPDYKDDVIPALLSLPTISLVTKKGNLFSLSTDPDSGGIYIHTNPPTGNGLGAGWERPVSFEYLHPDGSNDIQVDAGIRIHGGHSRLPEKCPKHSFRITFRSEYGPKKLNYDFFGGDAASTFNALVLRAGFGQTWLHWTASQREMAQYINDAWVKDTYRKMGHVSAHNSFVHLYINGLYWGVYNLSERLDKEFMASYFPGEESEFDVIKDYAELADGEMDAWDAMMDLAEDIDNFMLIQGKKENGEDDPSLENYVDMDNLMDYMILNFYTGNKDWDHHNWVASRNRVNPGKGFRFFPWDSEQTFGNLRDNNVHENNNNRPSFIYAQYRHDPRFRQMLTDKAIELLKPGGILSPDSARAGWEKRSEEIRLAIIAESARWGDYRRDVHRYQQSGPFKLYTPQVHWEAEQDRLYQDFFPLRSDTVYNQLLPFLVGIENGLPAFSGDFGHFPNPFSSELTIFYELATPGSVEIDIFDLFGRKITTLYGGSQQAGLHELTWIPQDQTNGLYFYEIRSNHETRSGKVIRRLE